MKYLLKNGTVISGAGTRKQDVFCLLYTSDAADDDTIV